MVRTGRKLSLTAAVCGSLPAGGGKDEKTVKKMLEKVNALLQSNGRQELSADEAEKIAGGEFTLHDDGTCTLDDSSMTCDRFTSLMYAMTKVHGIKAAIGWLHEKTEFWCAEMGKNAMG